MPLCMFKISCVTICLQCSFQCPAEDQVQRNMYGRRIWTRWSLYLCNKTTLPSQIIKTMLDLEPHPKSPLQVLYISRIRFKTIKKTPFIISWSKNKIHNRLRVTDKFLNCLTLACIRTWWHPSMHRRCTQIHLLINEFKRLTQKWAIVLTSMVFWIIQSSVSRNFFPLTIPALLIKIVTSPTSFFTSSATR